LTEDKTTSDLSAVLEQLAIIAASTIKAHEPEKHDQLFHAFVQALDQHLGGTPCNSIST
jgi:hypothetical protein